ncbi:unnamed protein product [Urochloa humidicola]
MAPNKRLVLLAALLLVAAVGHVRCDLSAVGRPMSNVLLAGLPSSLSNVIAIINGTVPCSTGSNINPASVLPFPNATVQLVCGTATVASATTGSTGIVTFILGPISNLTLPVIDALLRGRCTAVVATPLVACNASLQGVTGTLTSSVQLLNVTSGLVVDILGNTVTIVNGVINLVTVFFTFIFG